MTRRSKEVTYNIVPATKERKCGRASKKGK